MPTRTLALMVASAALLAGVPAPAAAPPKVDPPSVDLTIGPGGSAALTKKVTTPVIPPNPDIVLLGDTTGSMIDVLDAVAADANAITGQVRHTQPTAQFAVAQYKHHIDGPAAFSVTQPLTANQEHVTGAIQEWVSDSGGGGIPASDFVNALYQVAGGAVAFRPGSSRIVAWFGDSHSEDPSIGHTLAQAIAALKAKEIRVVAVPVAGTDGGGLDSLGQASAITSQTGGVLMPGTSPGAVAQAILKGVENLDATVTHQVSGCAPQLTATLSPASKTVQSGQTVQFAETIGVKAGTKPGTYQCKVQFLVNGAPHNLVQTITVRVPGVVLRDVSVREGDLAKVRVSLDRASSTPITVHYRTVDGTATAASRDYTAAEGDLTFAPGEVGKQVLVQTIDNDDYRDGAETFTVAFTQGGTAIGAAKVTIEPRHSCGASAVKLHTKDIVAAHPGCGSDTRTTTVAGTKFGAGQVAGQATAVSARTGKGAASASVGSVRITVSGQVVEIGTIESHAACGAAGSRVGSVKVGGVEARIGSGPVTIPLAAGVLKFNSTTKSGTSVTQRAVTLDTALTDVVIGESRAGCVR